MMKRGHGHVQVALYKPLHDELCRIRDIAKEEFDVTISLSEIIDFLYNYYRKQKEDHPYIPPATFPSQLLR